MAPPKAPPKSPPRPLPHIWRSFPPLHPLLLDAPEKAHREDQTRQEAGTQAQRGHCVVGSTGFGSGRRRQLRALHRQHGHHMLLLPGYAPRPWNYARRAGADVVWERIHGGIDVGVDIGPIISIFVTAYARRRPYQKPPPGRANEAPHPLLPRRSIAVPPPTAGQY